MDLINILPKKKTDDDYYWAIVIEPEWVSAGIWKLGNKRVQVMSVSPTSAWSLDDELVSACDSSCSSVVQNLPEDIEPPTRTVFGLVSSWVDGGEIKPEYLGKIEKVCKELSLTPVGFVVIAEALSNYFKVEEGGQVNAIFLGVSRENLELSIFRLGKLVGVSQIARSVSVVDDVTEGLSRFYSGESYPSRMILYNSKEGELDEIKQELIKADWENLKEIKFLHTPKIETVPPDKKIYAICLAGGTEIGGESSGVEPPIKQNPAEIPNNVSEEKPMVEEQEEVTDKISPDEENVKEPDENISPEDFGFTVDTEQPVVTGFNPVPPQPVTGLENNERVEIANSQTEVLHKEIVPKKSIFSFFNNIFKSKEKVKESKPSFKVSPPKPLFIGLIVIILLASGLFAFWWFFPSVDVSIIVSPKNINDEVEITVDSNNDSSDFDNRILSGQIVKTSLSQEKSAPTTGTKTVGDKATGEITIYRSGSSLNLSKNTVIKGPQGLNFTLDDDITVASGSVLTRGITKAKVTASEIGAEYNLASGTTFTVSNYSNADMEATNESAFSGGTSREVSAVSDSDQKNLLKDLQSEIEDKLNQELANNVSSDLMMINESISYSVTNKEFDKKIGDEGSSFSLNLEIEAEGVAVKKSDIEELGLKYLKENVPEGYTLKGDQIEPNFTYVGSEDGTYDIKLLVSANLLPQINIDNIRKNISGKFPDVAEKYMSSNVPGFDRTVIKFNTLRFPGRLGTLPHVLNNIEISVSAEK